MISEDLDRDLEAEYLEELGFNSYDDPDPKEIQKAYRKLAKENHPDRNKNDEEKIEKFKRVHYAYKMLTDPSFRQQDISTKKASLNLTINYVMSFEQAFFGGMFLINTNVQIPTTKELEEMFDTKKYEIEAPAESVKITLPAGSLSGTTKVFKGKGLKIGNHSGDMIVSVSVKGHPKFRMQGSKIFHSEKVPLKVMLEGGRMQVQTMYGLKDLIIPPGTKPGDPLKIPKCGLNKKDYHYVTLDPVYPDQGDLKGKEWKKIKFQWNLKEEYDKELQDYEEAYNRMSGGLLGSGMELSWSMPEWRPGE